MIRKTKFRAGVVGAAGYTGGELLRLLLRHPYAEVAFAHSRSQAGKPLEEVHADLVGESSLHFTGEIVPDVDVVFLCLGHGESASFLEQHSFAGDVKIIDLSQDFRIGTTSHDFVYGLPEYARDAIRSAGRVANPGCFATAIQLALLPLAAWGKLQEVQVTGITGATGAGQKLQESSHFAWRAGNIQAYKTLSHQHLAEIRQTLGSLQSQLPGIHFIPWRGDFTRGIYVSACLPSGLSEEAVVTLYEDYYRDHPFTHVSRQMIHLKQVVNTNKCLLHLEQSGDRLVVHAAIDNLLKGASGQALQNMNLLFGLPEDSGLKLKASSF